MNKERLQRALLSAQALVVTFSLLVTSLLLYFLLFQQPQELRQGKALLPKPSCAGSGQPGKLTSKYQTSAFEIYYTDRRGACNAILGDLAPSTGGALTEARAPIRSFGLRPPREPVVVGLAAKPRGGPLQVYPQSGGRGALLLDPEAINVQRLALQGYAELALADAAPGLSRGARTRAGLAVALLSRGDSSLLSASARTLRSGAASEDGLYESWLTAQFGTAFLRETLERCRRPCRLSAARDAELRQRRANPKRLLATFVARATAPERQSALARRLARD